MNRIIIVGNGFDLAHGLKTKYEDFINWYWENAWKKLQKCITFVYKDDLLSIKLKYSGYCICNYFQATPQSDNIYNYIVSLQNGDNYVDNVEISPFLERISKSIETKGWVDIEADYYTMLKECKGKKDELERLNKDFAIIQGLLVEYLNEIQEKQIDESILCDSIKSAMLSPLSKDEIALSSNVKWTYFVHDRARDESSIGAFSHLLHDYEIFDLNSDKIKDLLKRNQTAILFDGEFRDQEAKILLLPNRIMLLNFNYTNTADIYLPDNPRFIINHIHGKLSKPESVIFGYGDESDDEYKAIVKQNDNEYLKHIKTNRYLEDDKYRQLLSFINSDAYQVCIMGHSCGLSDKTMLNTLFEHENCVSIKPYYYVNDQGKNNYLDMVQNISRSFTNPQLMRDRVVNKTFCETLPQG